MDPGRWNRVSEVFANAVELAAAERARLLEAEEDDVRLEVERLLGEHSSSGVLDRAIGGVGDPDWCGRMLNSRYSIERFLARGGAGSVYLARDEQVAGRAVVVKFLQSYARFDTWVKNKFREEMEALARIDHHGVVGILDAGETADGLPYLVIEYIDGVTLRSEIQKGPIGIFRAARLIRQIGRAVSAAHDKGVLHRDLKPENIMLENAGATEETVRLIDFGIASVDAGDKETLTHTTRFAGTTPYMAPEQLAGRPQAASDIYAIGVLAYEMLSGERPFIAASPVELYQLQRAGAKSGLRKLRPEIPPAAAQVILKQLSFQPEDRSPSAAVAGEQIAAALEGTLREKLSRRQVIGAVAAGAAAVGGAGAYFWSRGRPLDPAERVIEIVMGTEILEDGFQKSLDIDYHVLQNADATALDSLRVVSHDQGEYFHPLSAAQAREAQRIGWTLTIEAALEQGRLFWALDNPRAPRRYSGYLERNPDSTDTAGCLIVAVPVHQGIDRVLPGPAGTRHRTVMKWTPAAEAEFWVDGIKLVSGYSGLDSFRYARGLSFGATRYRSATASGVFWKIRFEIG